MSSKDSKKKDLEHHDVGLLWRILLLYSVPNIYTKYHKHNI